jgi:hypothetical protein
MSMELIYVRLRRSQEGGIMGWEGIGIRLMVHKMGKPSHPAPQYEKKTVDTATGLK